MLTRIIKRGKGLHEKQRAIKLRITALLLPLPTCNSASFYLQGKRVRVTGADATNASVAGTLAATKERSKQRDPAANGVVAVSAAGVTLVSPFGAAPEPLAFLRAREERP